MFEMVVFGDAWLLLTGNIHVKLMTSTYDLLI